MKSEDRIWIRGYAAALSSIERLFHQTSMVKWIAVGDGLTLADFKAAGCDAFDMKALCKAFAKHKTTDDD